MSTSSASVVFDGVIPMGAVWLVRGVMQRSVQVANERVVARLSSPEKDRCIIRDRDLHRPEHLCSLQSFHQVDSKAIFRGCG